MTLQAGDRLSDNLRLLRVLGRGAMGTVWVAENLALGSEVAVKVLHHGVESDEARARFAQEARGVAAIDSPHVVTIFDYGVTEGGDPYIVMELLRGEDLRERIERDGPLSAELTAKLVQQIARALGRAHDLDIIHRDIKPANIFVVDNDGEPLVKVLDFGVAKRLSAGDLRMTETGAMMGTPYYMSPEQLLDPRSVDARTDLWAVGAVTYACLTASLPFVGETLGALSVAIHTGDFEPPSARNPKLPPQLDSWMAKALSRKPEARFGSAREMATALLEAVGQSAPGSAEIADASADVPAPGAVADANTDLPAPGAESADVNAEAPARGAESADVNAELPAPGAESADANTELPAPGAAASSHSVDAATESLTADQAAIGGASDRIEASDGSQVEVGKVEEAGGEPAAISPMSQLPAPQAGLGRMGLVALAAALLAGGGVLAGVKLSAPAGTQPLTPSTAGARPDTTSGSLQPDATATAPASASASAQPSTTATAIVSTTAVASSDSQGPHKPASIGGSVNAATVRSATLACWKANEGGRPDTPAAGVTVVFDRNHVWGAAGLMELQGGPSFAPRFMKCAVAAARRLFEQFHPTDGDQMRVPVSLPGKQVGPAFPSEAEARAGVLACWASHDGSQQGTPASTVRIWFRAKGGASGPGSAYSRPFKRCVMDKIHDWKRRGHDPTKRIDMTLQLPAGPAASAPGSGGNG